MGSTIVGTGSYIPTKEITNEAIIEDARTDKPGGRRRAGLRSIFAELTMGFTSRYYASEEQTTSDLALEAAIRAMASAGVAARDLGIIVVTTSTPDKKGPSTADILQEKLGAGGGSAAIQLNTACAGFIYGLHIADSLLICNPHYEYALLVSADKMSSIVDRRDFPTALAFGDGSGAVVLKRYENGTAGLMRSYIGSDGERGSHVHIPAGGSAMPITPSNCASVYERGLHCIQTDSSLSRDYAIGRMSEAATRVLEWAGICSDRVDYLIPQQGGRPLVTGCAERLNIPLRKVLHNYQTIGNTSQAAIPILLDTNFDKFKPGNKILMTTVGGGFDWGAALFICPPEAPQAG